MTEEQADKYNIASDADIWQWCTWKLYGR